VQRVVINRDFSLPPERIFAYLAEHENLEAIFGAKIKRVRDGDDGSRNGVGSVRQLKIGPLPSFDETVIEFDESKLIRYRITRGSPLRKHEGTMNFLPRGEGTHMHYEISFGAVVPGLDLLVAIGLRRNIAKGLASLDARA
jgi:uncharacterized protein YndB with AHSA1/START domain